MTGNRASAILLMVSVVASGCAEPLEFADWTIPIPEGTQIFSYRHVPDEERTEVLQLERELVLEEAFGRPFFQPSGVAVAGDGRIFVLDQGNHRVVGFDATGEPLVAFGGEGEGPGEFRTPENIALVNDRLLINDRMGSKFSVYATNGRHLSDHRLEARLSARGMVGLGDDLLVIRDDEARHVADGEMVPGELVVGRYSAAGEELNRIMGVPYVWRAYWGSGPMIGSVPMRAVYASTAVEPRGTAYFTNGDEYQVLAMNADGASRFALRVNYVPQPLDEERKHEAMREAIESFSQFVPDLDEADFVWPDRHQAIDRLAVDGRGNLYVFPLILPWLSPEPSPEGPFAVDVYSPTGERVFTGKMPVWWWDAARDDSLYAIETDVETGESIVVRYRLLTDIDPAA